MKLTFAVLCVMAFPLMHAADKAFRFTLHEAATLNGTALKPADYRIEVNGNTATLSTGKTALEAPVKLENADRKFRMTVVGFENSNGTLKINEIDIGGSTTRIVFPGAGQ